MSLWVISTDLSMHIKAWNIQQIIFMKRSAADVNHFSWIKACHICMHNFREKVHEIIVFGKEAKVKWICQISEIRMSLSLSVHWGKISAQEWKDRKKVSYGLALTDLLPSLAGVLKYQSSFFVCKLVCHPFRRFSSIDGFVLSLLHRWVSLPLSAWYSPIGGEILSYKVQWLVISSQDMWLISPELIFLPDWRAISIYTRLLYRL